MKIECYEGSSGLWSWQLKSGNNQVIARSDDTYMDQAHIGRAAKGFAEKFKEPPELVFIPVSTEPSAPPETEEASQ